MPSTPEKLSGFSLCMIKVSTRTGFVYVPPTFAPVAARNMTHSRQSAPALIKMIRMFFLLIVLTIVTNQDNDIPIC
jgi:hypothetical protein